MKTLFSIFISIAVVLGFMTVSVSAADYKDTAKSLGLGKQVSGKLKYDEGEFNDYKITMPGAGTLTLTLETFYDGANGTYLSLYDSNDRYQEAEDVDMISGSRVDEDEGDYCLVIDYNNSKKNKTVFTYELKKGTYYIRLHAWDSYGTDYSFKMSVKANDLVKEPLFIISIGTGKSATLGHTFVIDKDDDDEVIWKSSASSIAKVSQSGKITGVKKGTADIKAAYKDKEIMIRVKVS